VNGQIVKGHLELLLLSAVEVGPAHGYVLIERLRDQSGGVLDFPEGTIYPALHRLERTGVLSSTWDEEAPRRRRVYALTSRGRRELARQRESWREFSRAVELVIRAAS
jgi:PadR family transcriptional regulator, regulatory protein PadR